MIETMIKNTIDAINSVNEFQEYLDLTYPTIARDYYEAKHQKSPKFWESAYISKLTEEGMVCKYYWWGNYGATDEEKLTVPWDWLTDRETVIANLKKEHLAQLDAEGKTKQEKLQREKTELESRLASSDWCFFEKRVACT